MLSKLGVLGALAVSDLIPLAIFEKHRTSGSAKLKKISVQERNCQ
jgi:hypothetical protein